MGLRVSISLVAVIVLVLIAPTLAQQTFTPSDSPFQGEFEYTVGDQLNPQVAIANLRWLDLRVFTKSGKEIKRGKPNPTTIELRFDNRSDETRTATVVILFEDEIGNSLLRHACEPVRVNSGDEKIGREKVRIQGDVLLATQKIYVYCEVE
jgi:hypothetical protein